jgi:cell division septation protein DedD
MISSSGVTGAAPPSVHETRQGWTSVRRVAGRFQLALTWPQLAIAGVALVVLLVVAYQIGRRSAERPDPNALSIAEVLADRKVPEPTPTQVPSQTQAQPPTPGRGHNAVVTPPAPAPPEKAAVKPPVREALPQPKPDDKSKEAETLVPDSFYIVVQHFRLRDRERASAAQEFLRSKGVRCLIRTGPDLQLIATERFASETQADALRKRIVDLGKEYRESGGGYDFASAKARKF